MNPSDALLTIGVEGLAVGIFTLIAGSNDDVGNVVIVFMIGLWIMFMINHASLFKNLATITTHL